jgi:hypothetical protein
MLHRVGVDLGGRRYPWRRNFRLFRYENLKAF